INTDPLTAPACDGVTVTIITESPDPLWSFAALRGPADPEPKLHRVGDVMGDKTVAYIGNNPVEHSPSVGMESGASLCQVLLVGAAENSNAPKAAPAAKADPKAKKSAAANAVPSDIADKIRKVSDTEFEVD